MRLNFSLFFLGEKMNKTNSSFFNEYKRLEKLLNDMYEDSHGVTRYIDDMRSRYPDTDRNLKKLKRIRYIRNHLAHDMGAFEEECATQDDILWIRDFYERILSGTDPLSAKKRHYGKSANKWKTVFITLVILVIISVLIAVCINSLIF